MNARRGTTLIELMVAMALLVVFIGIAFSTFSSMLWQRAAARQMLEIRGTLRTASESISEEVRLAGWPTYPLTGTVENPYLVNPREGQLSDSLTIVIPDASPSGKAHQVRYYIEGTAATGWRLMREECQLTTDNTTLDPVAMHASVLTRHDPLTPYFTQIVHMYFACSGGRISTVMVARLQLQGRSRDVSVVGVTYVRNFPPNPSTP
jgi:prepilin-type N-terminal cleavage/methylation domain-containing protein